MPKKCKVLGCNNRAMRIRESGKHESMKGCYGYCQIHCIEGLVTESASFQHLKKNEETT